MSKRPTGQHTLVPTRLSHWHRASWSEALLALALIGAPLAIGGVHTEARIALAGILLLAFIGAAWRLAHEGREVRVGWVGVALLVALGWSFLQWLPWPSALVEALAPASFEARNAAAALTGLAPPSWMPPVIDTGRAADGVVTLLAVTCAYLTVTSLRFDGDVRARVASYLELSAIGVLLSALVHHALGLEAIWGLYEPRTSAMPAFASSFVNPNHAAALMLMGALVAFGASLAPARSQRWHLLSGVSLSVGVLASMSRANAVLLIVGLFALAVPPLFIARLHAERARLFRLLIGALCCLFVALVLIGPERWLGELANMDGAGLTGQGIFAWVWPVGVEVVGVQPLVGLGAGNFGLAATPFIEGGQSYLAYAHHGALQVLADLGVVVGSVVLGALVIGLVQAVVRGLRRSSEALPLWAGAVALVVLGLQNLVDFSLWIPGVGVPAAALLGLIVESAWPSPGAGGARARWWPAWRWPPWALSVPLGVLVVTAVPAHRERPEGWKTRAQEALAARVAAGSDERAQLERVEQIDRADLSTTHPHEHPALLLAAARADAGGQRAEAQRLLARALELAPEDPATLEAAIRERLRDRDEARARVLVERLDPRGEGSARAVRLVLQAPWAKALAEGFFGAHPQRALVAARQLGEEGRGPEADALLVWALERSPEEPALYEALGRRRWDDASFLSRLATSCLGEAGTDEDGARRARWERLGYLLEARSQALGGRLVEAYELYFASADAIEVPPGEAVSALLEAADAAQRLGRSDWLDEAMGRLDGLPIEGPWPRGRYHLLRSQQRERAGDVAAAIREMHEAVRHLGHVPAMHERLAALYLKAGDGEASERASARARALEEPVP